MTWTLTTLTMVIISSNIVISINQSTFYSIYKRKYITSKHINAILNKFLNYINVILNVSKIALISECLESFEIIEIVHDY